MKDMEKELENINYSKIFTEYNLLDYLQKRAYFYISSFYKYSNCSGEDEVKKDNIIDAVGEFLYKEFFELFCALKNMN